MCYANVDAFAGDMAKRNGLLPPPPPPPVELRDQALPGGQATARAPAPAAAPAPEGAAARAAADPKRRGVYADPTDKALVSAAPGAKSALGA